MKFFVPKSYKIANLVLLLVVLAGWGYVHYYYQSGLCLERCTYEMMSGLLDPIRAAAQPLALTLGLLLLLPAHYFRRWLWYVASWAVPVSLIMVARESVYAMNIMSGKTFMAGATMTILLVITVIFAVGVAGYGWFKGRKSASVSQ